MLARLRNLWTLLLMRVGPFGLFAWACVIVFLIVTNASQPAAAQAPTKSSTPTCKGKFMNPITDICWSCIFPMKVAGKTIASMNQEDAAGATGSGLCSCQSGADIKVGVVMEFWEPARLFEAVRQPHCYPSLGGIRLDPGFDAPEHAQRGGSDSASRFAFYQAHWYVNPIMFWLEVLMDNTCLEQGVFDLAYATEFDPLWDDDLMSFLLAPDSALFANIIAQGACAGDCVAATLGFGSNTLWWCAGCQGGLYPLTGWVGAHVGGVSSSALLMQRMTAKLHRQGIMWAGSGRDGLCSFYPQLLMDKTAYKAQMVYPIANTSKEAGRCCQPYGRTTTVWGAGKEFPYLGEDFAYQIFRKRSCCAGSSLWNAVGK